MGKIKDQLYHSFVRENEYVRYEYERYVMEHTVEHYEHRALHWKILLKLNWHYRWKKSREPLLYFDKNISDTGKKPTELEGRERKKRNGAENKTERVQKPVFSRPSPVYEARVYGKYDIISFDIFDTLILRPFLKPSDLFLLVGEKLDIMDFKTIRMEAEEAARRERELKCGNREITIYDIYRIISWKTGISVEEGVRVEFETECELCFANPYMKRIYELLFYGGKRIILVSDMYYPEELLRILLEKCGYGEYEKLFVSCDYNCSKANRELFHYVLDYAKEDSLIHIGDNVKSDVEIPKSLGIRCVHYRNVNEIGKRYRPADMSYLIGSAYGGLVNAWLYNGLKKNSPYFEYGFVYAGIYILGYCCWIHNYAKENHIEKLLFLSRDGDIYEKVYHLLFSDIEAEYVYWSRIPSLKLTAEKNRYPYIKALILDKARDLYHTKLRVLLEEAGISVLLPYMSAYGLREEEYITPYNERIIERMFCDHWEEILRCYEKTDAEMKEYYRGVIGTHKKVAVVDVGWSGNIVFSLKNLIEEKWKLGCEVDCLLAAMRALREDSLETLELKKSVNAYMFSTIDNMELHKKHMSTNRRLNSFLFEMMTQSNSATFEGITDGKFKFEIPETENFEHNREVHEGIREFVLLYTKTFKNYEYMWQIPGRDAYLPFSALVGDLTFIKTYFSDYVFGRGVLSTAGEDGKETVKQVLDRAGL